MFHFLLAFRFVFFFSSYACVPGDTTAFVHRRDPAQSAESVLSRCFGTNGKWFRMCSANSRTTCMKRMMKPMQTRRMRNALFMLLLLLRWRWRFMCWKISLSFHVKWVLVKRLHRFPSNFHICAFLCYEFGWCVASCVCVCVRYIQSFGLCTSSSSSSSYRHGASTYRIDHHTHCAHFSL